MLSQQAARMVGCRRRFTGYKEERNSSPLQLLGHVLRDLVQRHVARALVHDLHPLGPGAARQLALRLQLRELQGTQRHPAAASAVAA